MGTNNESINMDKAKQAVSGFLSKHGQHDTTIHESVDPSVEKKTIAPMQREERQIATDREVHQDHYHTTVPTISGTMTMTTASFTWPRPSSRTRRFDRRLSTRRPLCQPSVVNIPIITFMKLSSQSCTRRLSSHMLCTPRCRFTRSTTRRPSTTQHLLCQP